MLGNRVNADWYRCANDDTAAHYIANGCLLSLLTNQWTSGGATSRHTTLLIIHTLTHNFSETITRFSFC